MIRARAKPVQESQVWGFRIFHSDGGHLWGVTGLPDDFVAIREDKCLVVGDPSPLVREAAQEALTAHRRYWRAHRVYVEAGQGARAIKGLLIDLCV